MNAPRILHLFANYKWTGPADPAIRCAAGLRAQGLDVVFAQAGFVHHGGEHRMSEELARRAVPVVAGLELRKHFHVPSLLRDVRVLRQLLARDRYDLLHCHQTQDHLLAALAVRRLARPPVLVRTLYEPAPPPRGWRERWSFRRTQGVVAPTRAAAAGLRAFALPPSAEVLHQEPVTDRREPGPDLRARLGLRPQHRVVGITARIQPHRRFDLLWAVAAAVCARLPEARFVLLGRGNEHDTQQLVHQPIAAHGLQDKVVLPGYLKDPDYSAALRALDAFLFLVPGSDGTCRAVREAMAAGLPVVSTQRGILPELLAPTRPGEVPGFACAEAVEPLAAALLDLLGDEPRRQACGAAAQARARRDMDPVAAAQRLVQLYEGLLAGRREPA